ncbi:hypothetical protein RCL1_003318 [Eukaryota sp. TZLM3-RCL]
MDIITQFKALDTDFTNGSLVYILPKKWLDSFLQGNPDPEIDFNAIIDQLKTTSIPSQPTLKTLKLLPDLAIGSDVSIVNEKQWQLLTSHFTYKPKIPIIREVVPKTSDPNSELMVDLYPCTVQIRKYPENHSTPMTLSSVSPISQLRSKIASHFHTSPSSLTISFQSGTFGIMTSISPSDDDMTLSDKGIVDGSKVNIIIRHGQALSDPIASSSSFFTGHRTYPSEPAVRSTPAGVSGLSNLGNTCFMNSCIQCLSNCDPLTQFSLSDEYVSLINTTNPIGSGGKIARAWKDTITQLHKGTCSVVRPDRLKHEVGAVATQFIGYRQHDAQEFLSFLLDYLHEDLNQVVRKPYYDTEIDENLDENLIAQETWKRHLSRNQSKILDLFTGLFKSQLECPDCKKIAITFDPTNVISVPIPDKSNFKAKIMVNLIDFEKRSVNQKWFLIDCQKQVTAGFLSDELSKVLNLPSQSIVISRQSYTGSKPELHARKSLINVGDPLYNHFTAHIVYQLVDNQFSILTGEPDQFVALSHCFSAQKSSLSQMYSHMSTQKEQLAVFYFSIKSDSIDDLKNLIEKFTEFFIESNPFVAFSPEVKLTAGYNRHILIDDVKESDLKPPYHYYGTSFVLEVVFNWDNRETFAKAIKILTESRDDDVMDHNDADSITLNDCLDLFTSSEILDEHNKWYCPACKDFQRATKKIELYSVPDILIIHLKRFKYDSFFRDKIDVFIDYPVQGLNLEPYVINSQGKSCIYDLFAVSIQVGGLGGGHYYSYAFNSAGNAWYEFDDSRVSPLNGSPVTRNAYVLFYKRRM